MAIKRTLQTKTIYTGPNLSKSRGEEILEAPNYGRNVAFYALLSFQIFCCLVSCYLKMALEFDYITHVFLHIC